MEDATGHRQMHFQGKEKLLIATGCTAPADRLWLNMLVTQKDREKMRQGTHSLKIVVVEVFSIVLGVMLALAVSQWQEDRDRQEQAEIALENIERELRWNLDLLTRVHENNTATIASMDEVDPESDEERSLIPALQLRETAYQTLLSAGIANFVEYELVLSLSEAYSMQGVYKQIGQQLSEAAMNMAAYATVAGTTIDNQKFQEQFRAYFEMMVSAEAQLLKTYGKTLADLDVTDP